jgi:hypothetical protein
MRDALHVPAVVKDEEEECQGQAPRQQSMKKDDACRQANQMANGAKVGKGITRIVAKQLNTNRGHEGFPPDLV